MLLEFKDEMILLRNKQLKSHTSYKLEQEY